MNRYILIPEDAIRVLPPEDGSGAAIEIFCSRTVIYFEIAQLREVCLLHHVREQKISMAAPAPSSGGRMRRVSSGIRT